MEGAHTTQKAASDSMKDATTLSCPAGNGSREHNSNGTLRTRTWVIGPHAFVLRMGSISKNNSLNSERPVQQTHRALEHKSRIRTQPSYHTTHQTQPNAAPKTQDALDAAPKTQDIPDAAPNTQDAT